MHEVWIFKNGYIQGEKVHKGLLGIRTAKKLAAKIENFFSLEKSKEKSDVIFWIEDDSGFPIGLILKTKKNDD